MWPENESMVGFFVSLKSQWRETPLGWGLDYAGVHACINAAYPQRHKRRSVFSDVQMMESVVNRVLVE